MSQREVPGETQTPSEHCPVQSPDLTNTLRAIVHFMDDDERALACQLMPSAHFTESTVSRFWSAARAAPTVSRWGTA